MEPLFCDNHLLVLDKPHGLLTQPSGTSEPSLEEQGKLWLKEKYAKPGAVFLEAVHRIDRVVGGVVLFARTSKALSRLNEAMRQGRIQKWYRARVEGVPKERVGTLVDWLRHGEGLAEFVGRNAPEARRCELDYEVLEAKGGRALLEIHLKTGRYHQIRAQLAHAGWPICGDVKYGAGAMAGCTGGIALISCRIEFEHPVTHEHLAIQSRMTL